MEEKRMDEVLGALPRDFNDPPPPPLEEMWAVIEAAHFNNLAAHAPRRPRAISFAPWLAAAATLVVGIAIGRNLPSGDTEPGADATSAFVGGAGAAAAADTSPIPDVYRDQANQYLGQTAALLISLPAAGTAAESDERFAGKAADLLVTTRLLMDSPAAQDPKLRGLLEDLELVLVQIARLRVERNKSDLDLIHQTVEQGDVISRLNSASVTTQSAE
jgi:hypothetical protein